MINGSCGSTCPAREFGKFGTIPAAPNRPDSHPATVKEQPGPVQLQACLTSRRSTRAETHRSCQPFTRVAQRRLSLVTFRLTTVLSVRRSHGRGHEPARRLLMTRPGRRRRASAPFPRVAGGGNQFDPTRLRSKSLTRTTRSPQGCIMTAARRQLNLLMERLTFEPQS